MAGFLPVVNTMNGRPPRPEVPAAPLLNNNINNDNDDNDTNNDKTHDNNDTNNGYDDNNNDNNIITRSVYFQNIHNTILIMIIFILQLISTLRNNINVSKCNYHY